MNSGNALHKNGTKTSVMKICFFYDCICKINKFDYSQLVSAFRNCDIDNVFIVQVFVAPREDVNRFLVF